MKITGSFRSISSWALIAVNLVPLFGVIFLGWDIFEIILIYWIESLIVGVFNFIKMFWVGFSSKGKSIKTTSKKKIITLFYILFFLFHYNLFLIGQLVFIVILMGSKEIFFIFSTDWYDLLMPVIYSIFPAIGAIILSHFSSFIYDFIIRKESKSMTIELLMIQPYKRIFVQQFVIIFGGMIFLTFKVSEIFIVVLVVLKIIIDLRAHERERKITFK